MIHHDLDQFKGRKKTCMYSTEKSHNQSARDMNITDGSHTELICHTKENPSLDFATLPSSAQPTIPTRSSPQPSTAN
jgi:hypothetical protein